MKQKKVVLPEQASVDPETLWCLLLYSMRYGLGRASSAPSDICNWIRRYRQHLKPWQVEQIAEEIEKELTRCNSKGTTLGHRCDHEEWTRLVADLRSPR